MNKQYIIIGSSAAGISALQTVASAVENPSILCVSRDSITANICLLADVLARRRSEEDLFFVRESLKQHIQYDSTIIKIDKEQRCIITADHQKIYYEKLLIATGTDTVIKNDNLSGIFSFHTHADLSAINIYLKEVPVKHVTVVGGGFTGLECADALIHRGYQVTLIERESSLLSRTLDEDSAEWLLNRLDIVAGCEFILGRSIEAYERGNGHVQSIVLTDGTSKQTDMVIYASGVTAASDLALEAGLAVKQGILVDEYMQTSDSAIFAAGDCTVFKNRASSCRTWPHAVYQGRVAALNMLDRLTLYQPPLQRYSSQFFGQKVISLNFNPKDIVEYRTEDHAMMYCEQAHGTLMLGEVSSAILKDALEKLRKNA